MRVPPALLRNRLRLALLTMLLAACFGGDDPDERADVATPSATGAPSPTAPSPTATATVQPSPATPGPQPTAEPAPRAPLGVAARATTNNLNVRAGPGTDYPVIGRLQVGDIMDVAGRSPDGKWLALHDPSLTRYRATWFGWVFYNPDWVAMSASDLESLPTVAIAPARGLPNDLVGPLIVFMDLESFAVATYDLGTHREVARFATQFPISPRVSGTGLLIQTKEALLAVNLDGSIAPIIPDDQSFAEVYGARFISGELPQELLSPDTSIRALVVGDLPQPGEPNRWSLAFAEAETGRELLSVPAVAFERAGLSGPSFPSLLAWRDDGTGMKVALHGVIFLSTDFIPFPGFATDFVTEAAAEMPP